jgi:hypothetical protein
MTKRRFKPNEISCYADALARAVEHYGSLGQLPQGALQEVGGLLPATAREVEAVIRGLQAQGQSTPSLPLVMSEIDRRIEY